jgi:hypothetical protein
VAHLGDTGCGFWFLGLLGPWATCYICGGSGAWGAAPPQSPKGVGVGSSSSKQHRTKHEIFPRGNPSCFWGSGLQTPKTKNQKPKTKKNTRYKAGIYLSIYIYRYEVSLYVLTYVAFFAPPPLGSCPQVIQTQPRGPLGHWGAASPWGCAELSHTALALTAYWAVGGGREKLVWQMSTRVWLAGLSQIPRMWGP